MAKNITWLGNQYSNVGYVDLPQTGGGTARFDDCSVVTATASDVAQGKVFVASDGTVTTGTASGGGGGGNDFIVTFTEDQNGNWSPDCTFADIQAAFTAGKTISTVAYEYQAFGEPTASYGYYEEGDAAFYGLIEKLGNNKCISYEYQFDSNGFVVYTTYESYYTSDATALPTDVANGKIFYNANGRQTGTASGGGGSSSWTKVAENTYTVSTTNTSAQTVSTWATGHSEIWTSDKILYIRIRDTAGKREGYFYGTDSFYINPNPVNGASDTSFNTGIRVLLRNGSSGYGISTSAYGVYPDTVYSDGSIRIRKRYSSNLTLTINGTYKVEVYLLDPPTGAPIFE